jgi:hypothetical protein
LKDWFTIANGTPAYRLEIDAEKGKVHVFKKLNYEDDKLVASLGLAYKKPLWGKKPPAWKVQPPEKLPAGSGIRDVISKLTKLELPAAEPNEKEKLDEIYKKTSLPADYTYKLATALAEAAAHYDPELRLLHVFRHLKGLGTETQLLLTRRSIATAHNPHRPMNTPSAPDSREIINGGTYSQVGGDYILSFRDAQGELHRTTSGVHYHDSAGSASYSNEVSINTQVFWNEHFPEPHPDDVLRLRVTNAGVEVLEQNELASPEIIEMANTIMKKQAPHLVIPSAL